MIAEVLKEDFFAFEEMAKILDVKPSTLRSRIYTGTKHPPYIKEGTEYLFPKDSFRDWVRSKPRVTEVCSA